MKCKVCGGTGMVDYPMYADDEHKWQYCVARMKKCDMCNGTGEVPMTNEEWFTSLSTEEKARFLEMICYSAWGDKNSRFKDMADYTDWMEWLKEKHQ